MAIEILEIHHTGVRIDNAAKKLSDMEVFYKDVLGLERDQKRPTIPGIPGAWINVGEVGQIHLIGGDQPSPVAKGPGEDPTRPHVAFAVRDIVGDPQGARADGRAVLGDRGADEPGLDAGFHERSLRQHGRAASVRQMPLPGRQPHGLIRTAHRQQQDPSSRAQRGIFAHGRAKIPRCARDDNFIEHAQFVNCSGGFLTSP